MLDKLRHWLPTRRDIAASTIGNVVVAVPGMIFLVVSYLAASVAAPQSDEAWVRWFLITMLALGVMWAVTAWGAVQWRQFRSLRPPEQLAETSFSEDPESDAPDKQAYNDILAFAIDRVLPACQALVDIQDVLIGHMSRGEKIAALTRRGMRSGAVAFWKHYDGLCEGLSASPGPMLKFEGIIEHIYGLEKDGYAQFSQQMVDLFLELERDKYPAMSKYVSLWRERHHDLVVDFDAVKRDTRFGKLLRPLKPSRWGPMRLGEPTE